MEYARKPLPRRREHMAREVLRERRRAELVGHDAHLPLFPRDAEDGIDEIFAFPPVQPRRAQDRRRRQRGEDEPLPRQLGAPVCAERSAGVAFCIRRSFFAVEDVIGGDVHEYPARLFHGEGEIFRPERVDGIRRLLLRFGGVHVRIGGAVEHGADLVFPAKGQHRRPVANIQLPPPEGEHAAPAAKGGLFFFQKAFKLPSELPAPARDEDIHARLTPWRQAPRPALCSALRRSAQPRRGRNRGYAASRTTPA